MKIKKQYPIFDTEFYDLDVAKLTAIEIEYHGLFFEEIGIDKILFEKTVAYYADNDLFWKFEKIRDEEGSYYTSTYYGLNFSIKKRGPLTLMGNIPEFFNSYYITQHPEGNAPESRKPERDYITSKQAEKLASLYALGKSYLTVYSLIAGILKKYPERVINAVVWEKYVYYSFSKGSSYVAYQDVVKFIKGDKGIVYEPEEERREGANLYDLFSDGSGGDAYVGDGVWISPGGNMHEP